MSNKALKILSAQIRRPVPAAEAKAARPAEQQLHLAVEVENPGDTPLYVWASRRAYDYDPSTHVLTLYLTEHTPPPPPGIQIISNHPRTPNLEVVKAKGRTTLDVPVPAFIRRRVPGKGLGMSFVEEPIGKIDRVDLHIQVSNEPVEDIENESPAEHRKRLALGSVVQATVSPTEKKEQ